MSWADLDGRHVTAVLTMALFPRCRERAKPHPADGRPRLRLLRLVLRPRTRIVARPVGQRPAETDHLGIQLEPVVAPANGEAAHI